MLKDKNIILGVSGSIAAYKIASLTSKLKTSGANVQVIMTKNATKIISPITFEKLTQNNCLIDTFDRNFEYKVGHISIAQKCDAFMIAPATANIIAKVANGLADDMLSTTFLASSCTKLIAPAMNTRMFMNPITQDNLKKCEHYGIKIINPVMGHLACGETGLGKMPEPNTLYSWLEYTVGYDHDLVGKNILITAGPTQEAIDPVRFITNQSTGKMGYAIAEAAANRGATVTLISGKTNLTPSIFVKTIPVISAEDMALATKSYAPNNDIIIKTAAVADFRPSSISDEKIKKQNTKNISLTLEPTFDILSWLGTTKRKNQFVCGFSMETQNLIENSRHKLEKKHLDMIVANNLKVEGAGFGSDTNIATIIDKEKIEELPKMQKKELAHKILDRISQAINTDLK